MPPEDTPEPLDLNSVIGTDVELQFNGETWTDWDKISVKKSIGIFTKNGADATREHKRLGRHDATGTISFIMGGKRIPSYMPGPGDEITNMKATVSDVNLFADLTNEAKYGKCFVIGEGVEQGDDQGTISFDIAWCFD